MDEVAKKIKHIIVTTDFSKNSDFAILRAVEIAKVTQAKLTLLHVIQKEFFDKILEAIIPREILQTAEEYTATLIQGKIQSLSRHKLNINYAILSKGKPVIKILRYAKKYKADLLVMGAHGKYSIRDSFVGTTAEYVIERNKCPVLIVKNYPNKPFKKILVPVDFSNASKKALNFSFQLFSDRKIRLFHVGDYEFDNLLKQEEKKQEIKKNKLLKMRKAILSYLDNKMKKFIRGYNKLSKSSRRIVLGYPGPTIVKEAEKANSDIIVMGTQGHGRFHYRFIGSVANWVLTETNKDILFVPPKN